MLRAKSSRALPARARAIVPLQPRLRRLWQDPVSELILKKRLGLAVV